jgi:uncharacterized protein GlcG (DUF336 family)
MKTKLLLSGLSAMAVALAGVHCSEGATTCGNLPDSAQLRFLLTNASAGTGISAPLGVPGSGVGGLFGGTRMWAAVVNREGRICSATTSTVNPSQVWPGSQAIAKAKAYTANAFSLDILPLSTAQLYTFVQPGHSLFGLNNSNPFDPKFLAPPGDQGGGQAQIAGGIITFGGGVPLYLGGQIIGGLGVSGDTACADHEVAKRVRGLAGLNPPGGPLADDITYSFPDGPGPFTHPHCPNTVRNGIALPNPTGIPPGNNENPAVGY